MSNTLIDSPDRSVTRNVVDSLAESRYSWTVSEARDLQTNTDLEPSELVWLDECLAEYRDLLEYLRDH
jgi:hypothetical protein